MSIGELFDRFDEAIGRGDSPAILRHHLATIREQIEAVEAELKEAKLELEATKLRAEGLEVKVQNQNLASQQDGLEEDTRKFLAWLSTSENSSAGLTLVDIARRMEISKIVAQYHADILVDAGMIDLAAGTPHGLLYLLTTKARAYVVKNKLGE